MRGFADPFVGFIVGRKLSEEAPMPMSRALALLTAMFIAASLPTTIDAATLSLVGSSSMVCQLIGETIWDAPGTTTAAKTLSNFGLAGVDLGFPVDSGPGPLYFLFGDGALSFLPTVPDHPPNSLLTVPPDDALGYTSRTTPPDSATCLDLQIATSAPKKFAHPTVTPTIQQGSFNVPTGGVFFDKKFYAFFWTDHCLIPSALTPNPRTPLRLPEPGACLETPQNSSIGRSVLAEATALSPLDFHWQPPPEGLLFTNMPSGFVYVSAANPPPAVAPPNPLASAIPVFGVPRYRASIPYMALAPRTTFDDPQTWLFFAGYEFGHPVWITRQKWESGHDAAGEWTPPAGAEIFAAEPADERCVGEHSVTWNAPLHSWLLLYTCVPWVVEARFAPEPWGPWSTPIILLSAVQDPGLNCTLIQSPTGCAGLTNEQQLLSGPWPGAFYAPFVMTRYTQDATPPGPGQPKRTTIYWLLSTWNPYVVVVMQSTLELQ
jgi:Domain of unknown function (DUF4185)